MIRYVPAHAAAPLSEALYALAKPASTRDPQDTQSAFRVHTAPDASRWLVVDTEHALHVHPDAELGDIGPILQPWIDKGLLPADTNGKLAARVEALRGQRLVLWESFPALFQGMSKTRGEMIAAGLLTELPRPTL